MMATKTNDAASHRSMSSRTSRSSAASSRQSNRDEELDKRIIEELDEWKELWRQKNVDEKRNKEEADRDKDYRRWKQQEEKRQEELQELRQKLLKASEKRKAKKLREAIKEVEEQQHEADLRDVYDRAVELLRSLDNVANMQKARDKLDHTTVVDIRSLNNMTEVVHQVVLASFMLLGYDGHSQPKIKNLRSSWQACQKECVVSGDLALHKRIKALESSSLQPKTVCDVLGVLDQYDREFVHKMCGAAGLLYDWAIGMCEEKLLTDEKTAKKREKAKERKQDEDTFSDSGDEDSKMKRCEHCKVKKPEHKI